MSRGYGSIESPSRLLMPTLVSKLVTSSLAAPYKKTYSTNLSAFKNGKYAEFLAAAANLASIPLLHDLPEVSLLLNEQMKMSIHS